MNLQDITLWESCPHAGRFPLEKLPICPSWDPEELPARILLDPLEVLPAVRLSCTQLHSGLKEGQTSVTAYGLTSTVSIAKGQAAALFADCLALPVRFLAQDAFLFVGEERELWRSPRCLVSPAMCYKLYFIQD